MFSFTQKEQNKTIFLLFFFFYSSRPVGGAKHRLGHTHKAYCGKCKKTRVVKSIDILCHKINKHDKNVIRHCYCRVWFTWGYRSGWRLFVFFFSPNMCIDRFSFSFLVGEYTAAIKQVFTLRLLEFCFTDKDQCSTFRINQFLLKFRKTECPNHARLV